MDMGLFDQVREFLGIGVGTKTLSSQDMLNLRISERAFGMSINREAAEKNSVVWACQHLRADLISQLPVDAFRRSGGIDVEIPLPKFFSSPNDQIDFPEWMYSTQVDLDGLGNTFGLVLARDGFGLPAQIELLPRDDLRVTVRGSKIIKVEVGSEALPLEEIWHERQYTRSGVPLGMSPIANAAARLQTYSSAERFAFDWFTGGAVPAGHLKNTAKKLDKNESTLIKQQFKASMSTGDVFVSGMDWTYSPLIASAADAQFLQMMNATAPEVCRFFGVPTDMVDVIQGIPNAKVTYANVTQRNLQLLVINLSGPIRRRENAFSERLLANPRRIKFNRNALLEMDIASRYAAHQTALNARFLAPSEVRALENLPPFTPEQIAEFQTLYGSGAPATFTPPEKVPA